MKTKHRAPRTTEPTSEEDRRIAAQFVRRLSSYNHRSRLLRRARQSLTAFLDGGDEIERELATDLIHEITMELTHDDDPTPRV